MAILYNEAYKPHDPSLERARQKLEPDAAFGIADMHRATFDEAKKGRDVADRGWEELPDDRDLAIEAEAWHLHGQAVEPRRPGPRRTPRASCRALGYDTGAEDMPAFARGGTPGGPDRSYLDGLRANWGKAGRVVGEG